MSFSLEEMQSLMKRTAPADKPKPIEVRATPSAEAEKFVRSRLPNLPDEVMQRILPRVERLMPQIRERSAKPLPGLSTHTPPGGNVPTPGTFPSQTGEIFPGQQQTTGRTDDFLAFAPMVGGVAAPMIGSALVAGPVGPGALLGMSVLGAGAGGAVNQSISGKAEPTLEEKGKAIAAEMALEFAGGKVVEGLGFGARVLRGNARVARETAEAIRRFGVQPALHDISDTPIVEGGRRVLGSFPILRKHFRKRLEETRKAFDTKTDEFIEELSPDTLLYRRLYSSGQLEEAAKVNEGIAKGGFESLGAGYEVMRNVQRDRWSALRARATEVERASGGAFVTDMPYTATRMRQVLDDLELEQVVTRDGALTDLAKGDPVGEAASFIVGLSKKEANQNFTGLIALKRRVSQRIDSFSDSPTAAQYLTRVKEGIEEDIEALLRGQPELRVLYDDANAVSSEFLMLLGDLVGRRTRTFQRGGGREAFRGGATQEGATTLANAGSRDPIEIIDTLARKGTPRELGQLFSVISRARGEDGARRMFGDVLARKLGRALDGSVKEAVEKGADPTYSPQNFLKLMGLDDPGSPQYAATLEMFKRAGINPRRAQDLGTVMQALFGTKNPKVSDFIARRGLLGGAASIISGATGGLAASTASGTGMIGPVAFFILGRSYSKWMTSPSRARLVVLAADGSAQTTARARALSSLLTDHEIWVQATEDERRVISEARNKLKTQNGRRELFNQIDKEFDFSGLNRNRNSTGSSR